MLNTKACQVEALWEDLVILMLQWTFKMYPYLTGATLLQTRKPAQVCCVDIVWTKRRAPLPGS